jgi:hypothetical protein
MARNRPTRGKRQIHIWLTETTRRKLKVRAAEQDMTVQAFVEDLIGRELDARRVR